MPTWLKLVLVAVGLGACGLAALIFGTWYWISHNKDRLMADAKEATIAGSAYGKGKTKRDCVDFGFAQLPECGSFGIVCETTNKIRLRSCLKASAPDSGFCADVPKMSDILDMTKWALEQCGRRGQVNQQPCQRFMQGIAEFCHGRVGASAPGE